MSKNVVLTDANDEQILPVTTAENVFDGDITVKERFARHETMISDMQASIESEISKIGTVVNGVDYDDNPITGNNTWVNATNNTNQSIARIELGKGTWVVTSICTFKSNNSGYRLTSIGQVVNAEGSRLALCQPVQSATTTVNGSIILQLEEPKTFYVTVRQTSGGDLECMPLHFKAVRIA